ncbi:peptidyl-prolyl cis-trans isomerase D [Desulfacinum hydrothermale DSM 13146]|uniref:Periplasmic chaperone PpiD n=1 Tax=Desulfacinum hydrothermale DSM 13146 TaxID=1121390 RepID=A0A1W1XFG6_9BACT|nr:SurA N-terminal domain-containing protein [Desulfacinum hydrothermale]SMC22241.1 peptidyl-prolyl cis-trans isomerase D [Desulfacinum hydrothermale DSM 13146]
MLAIFRQHATSWLIKVALFAIVIVFIFWGGYSYQSRKASRLARVGDVFITYADYNRAYDQLLNVYRQRFGNKLNQDLLKQLDAKRQAMDLLIDRVLIAQAARKLGLETTAEELQREILSYPVFQRNGRFDQQLYVRVLRQNRMTPEIFEQQLAQDLMLRKVESFVKRQAVVSDAEVEAVLRHAHSQIRVAYVTLDPKAFEKKVRVDEAAAKDYFQKNKDTYKEPEKRQLAWVAFPIDDYTKDVSVSEEELKAYYEDHPEEFHREKQVRARHILFRLDENAPEDEVKKVESQARDVLAKARKGEDFARLAEQYSQGPSASQGGDLGYFKKDQMVPAFTDAAFALKPGEISDLVRTRFGYHIIKSEDVRPEETIPFEKARAQIELTLKREKARDIAYERARDFADAAFADGDVTKAAQRMKLSAQAPPQWFAATEPLPKVGRAPKAMKEFFALDQDQISNVIEYRNGYLVAQVKGIKAPEVPPFEQVRHRVLSDFKADQARREAEKSAKELLEAAATAGDLEKAAKEKGLSVAQSGWFSRSEPDKDLMLWGEAAEAVFRLTKDQPLTKEPVPWQGKFLVCRLLDRRDPSPEKMEKDRQAVRAQLLQTKQNQLWQAWLSKKRREADVEILQEI